MYKIGLKLWSININYISLAVDLYNKNIFNYIELFSVPDSFNDYIKYWENLNIPFIIHAPHFVSGLNLSLKENKKKNFKLFNESQKFAERLKSDYIIMHPGINGTKEETANQLLEISDNKILIENKPFLGLNNDVCIGHSPDTIKYFLDKVKNIGFCFDIGHAICSANYQKKDIFNFLKSFIELEPIIYHLSDGDMNGVYDKHYHFGEGTYPINKFLDLIPEGSMITNEAKKDSNDNLDDFIKDIEYISKKLSKTRKE